MNQTIAQLCVAYVEKFISGFASFPATLPRFHPRQMSFVAELEAVLALPAELPPPQPDELVLLHSLGFSCDWSSVRRRPLVCQLTDKVQHQHNRCQRLTPCSGLISRTCRTAVGCAAARRPLAPLWGAALQSLKPLLQELDELLADVPQFLSKGPRPLSYTAMQQTLLCTEGHKHIIALLNCNSMAMTGPGSSAAAGDEMEQPASDCRQAEDRPLNTLLHYTSSIQHNRPHKPLLQCPEYDFAASHPGRAAALLNSPRGSRQVRGPAYLPGACRPASSECPRIQACPPA